MLHLKLIIISKVNLISITLPWSINHKAPTPRKKDIWSVQMLLLIAFFWKLKNELTPREVTEYIWINPKSPLSVIAQLMVHPDIYVKMKKQDFSGFKERLYFKSSKFLSILKKIKSWCFPYQIFFLLKSE